MENIGVSERMSLCSFKEKQWQSDVKRLQLGPRK